MTYPDRGHGECSDCQHDDDRTWLDLAARWAYLVGGVTLLLIAFVAAIIDSQLS